MKKGSLEYLETMREYNAIKMNKKLRRLVQELYSVTEDEAKTVNAVMFRKALGEDKEDDIEALEITNRATVETILNGSMREYLAILRGDVNHTAELVR